MQADELEPHGPAETQARVDPDELAVSERKPEGGSEIREDCCGDAERCNEHTPQRHVRKLRVTPDGPIEKSDRQQEPGQYDDLRPMGEGQARVSGPEPVADGEDGDRACCGRLHRNSTEML